MLFHRPSSDAWKVKIEKKEIVHQFFMMASMLAFQNLFFFCVYFISRICLIEYQVLSEFFFFFNSLVRIILFCVSMIGVRFPGYLGKERIIKIDRVSNLFYYYVITITFFEINCPYGEKNHWVLLSIFLFAISYHFIILKYDAFVIIDLLLYNSKGYAETFFVITFRFLISTVPEILLFSVFIAENLGEINYFCL